MCIIVERRALFDFKNNFTNDFNRLASWISEEEECCNWIGVLRQHNQSCCHARPWRDGYYRRDQVNKIKIKQHRNILKLVRNDPSE
ncbi:hypothetical protein Gogos_010801, partial [Gossypium gossypioides]|nr:hypothetical protein [Gossypium gossypioides]